MYSIFELLPTCFYPKLLNRFVKASSAHFTALARRQKFLQVYGPFFRTGENDEDNSQRRGKSSETGSHGEFAQLLSFAKRSPIRILAWASIMNIILRG